MASPSPSPPPPPLSSARERRGVGHRGMVEIELDAARALTDLAGSAATGRVSGGEEWERNESRSRKRSKSKSPERAQLGSFQGQEETSILGGACSTADCDGDYTAADNVVQEGAHIKVSSELGKSTVKVPSNYSSLHGSRSKQNLMEVEKEQRRLRRVIANRESARQTIRRRQALREELTRKVADLSLENEKMKMEKDIAMRQYLSLKETNEQLKDQITKTVRPEADQNVSTATTEMESPKTGRRFLVYGRSPVIQFIYPSWPSIWGNTLAFCGQANTSNISGSVPPQNMPSCAWYYPFGRGEHGLGQSYGEAANTERAAVHGTDDKENSLLATFGTEKANAPEAAARGGVSGSINKDEQILKTPAEETITKGSSHDEKCELQHDKGLLEKLQGACTQPPDKLSNATSATAAGEARRRRMELRKLKQCHGGQEDMRC
ncbi:BRLZ [Musa troglodytarum]|uniref:BRLZ n=1 Tax=Musa troglodytarum TaxID=320322 RepID=A0A9E7K988_9LILI|nr:BRLZ [Musa troglodytarum]